MIPISGVLEEAAREADAFNDGFGGSDAQHIARAIRALIPKYEGCIVAEGEPVCKTRTHMTGGNAGIAWSAAPIDDAYGLPLMPNGTPLYRAKETK
jgi:hypothetical protein